MMVKTFAAKRLKAEKSEIDVYRVASNTPLKIASDAVAREEPLEIRLGVNEDGRFSHQAVSITMRTPGDDFELAAGFLFTEGILKSKNQILNIKHCGKLPALENTVRIDLQAGVEIDFKKLERHFYTSSSCGVCGKSAIEALSTGAVPIPD